MTQEDRGPRAVDVHGPVGRLASRANTTVDLGDEHARWAVYRWAFDHDEAWADLLEATRVDPDTTLATTVALEMLARVPEHAAQSWIAACPHEARDLVADRARDIAVLRDHQLGSRVRRSAPATEWSEWLQRRVAATCPDPGVLTVLAGEGRTRRVRAAARHRLDHRSTTTRFDGGGEPITSGMPTCGLYQVRMPDGAPVQLHDMDLTGMALTDATGGTLRLVFRWPDGGVPAAHKNTPYLVMIATRVVIEHWEVDPEPSENDDILGLDWDGTRILTLDTTRRRLMFHADTVTMIMTSQAPTEEPVGPGIA